MVRVNSGIPLHRFRSEFFEVSFFRASHPHRPALFQISRRIFHAVARNYIKRRFRSWCRTEGIPPRFNIRVRALKPFDIRDRELWRRELNGLRNHVSDRR